MKKLIILLLMLTIGASFFFVPLQAAYNYSPIGEVIASAEALVATKVVDSSNLVDTTGERVNIKFGQLSDVVGFEDRIFITDASNSVVYVLNERYEFVTKFGDVAGDGKLNSPRGIFVRPDFIYVADTNNNRIAIFDHDYNFVRSVLTPDDPTFKQSPTDTQGYDFRPLKIAVDRTGRMYVIAAQIFEGILDFNPNGTFSRYVGANTVTLSVWDAFWLLFTTEAQRATQGFRLATTFVNLTVDKDGYVYTVSSSSEGERVIKKLNYKGQDVLIRNGYVPQNGDFWTIGGQVNVPTGSSEFASIDVDEYGTYSVLDRKRGRIFTYDFEGNLLYIGGQIGNVGGTANNQRSLFLQPEALSYFGENILVVDSMNENLVVMGYTEFADLVNQATRLYYVGDYDGARAIWEEVLVLNTNYYLAYAGIGKAQLRDGNYEEAMVNLKLGYDFHNYSKAYQQHRYDQLTVIFPYIIGFVILGIVFSFGKTIANSVKQEKEEEKNA